MCSNSEIKLVQITINYKGDDYLVEVDIHTANVLLNDKKQAEAYLKEAIPGIAENDGDEEMEFNKCFEAEGAECSARKVWFSKGKPSKDDEQATLLLLQLRERYADKFNDKKNTNSYLWGLIAKEIKEHGYDITPTKEGPAGKCRQKFVNLEKQYIAHIKHMRSTGSEAKNEPPFFDELHSILGAKAKVDPQHLQDTADESRDEDCSSNSSIIDGQEEISPSTKEKIKNRFTHTKKNLRPNWNVQLFEEMKRQHEIDSSERKREMEEVQGLLQVQNEQRKEMLKLFGTLVQHVTREREPDETSKYQN